MSNCVPAISTFWCFWGWTCASSAWGWSSETERVGHTEVAAGECGWFGWWLCFWRKMGKIFMSWGGTTVYWDEYPHFGSEGLPSELLHLYLVNADLYTDFWWSPQSGQYNPLCNQELNCARWEPTPGIIQHKVIGIIKQLLWQSSFFIFQMKIIQTR